MENKSPARPLDCIAAIVIDPTKIPKVEQNNLCSAILPAVNRFFENPENQKKFNDWKSRKTNV